MDYFKYLPEQILTRKIDKGNFPFSQNLFWDYPIETLDMEKHKSFVIERVLMRGNLQDFFFLTKIYSKTDLIDVIKKSKVFDRKLVNFCSLYFGIPKNEIHASSYYD